MYPQVNDYVSYVILLLMLPDEWLMYDDDKVSVVLAEDILKLSGGGRCRV